MQGLHLTADLHGCVPGQPAFSDVALLRRLCLAAVSAHSLTAVGDVFHGFPAPGGVTGVVLLAESHLAIHTWPELGAVTLDLYVCNLRADNSTRAEQLLAALAAAFEPATVTQHSLHRGLVQPWPMNSTGP